VRKMNRALKPTVSIGSPDLTVKSLIRGLRYDGRS
jgi:hypothetical protein